MNKYKEKFNKLNTNVIQLKKLIGELNNFINIIYNKVNLFWNRFENQYLFNKSILDSYNINNINYNRIMNMKNFYFNKDEYEQFENSINLNKIKELLENINNLLSEKEEINTFITPKYCLNWGLNEAIREIIQNQFDEIVTFIGGKNNLIIEKIGNEIEFSDNLDKKKMKCNYIFKKKNDDTIYGEIKYDKDKKELTISNIGELETGDLLFGCKKGIKKKDIIGRFG